MFIEIEKKQLHYSESGKGNCIVLLHGWGCQSETMSPIHKYLENKFRPVFQENYTIKTEHNFFDCHEPQYVDQ